MSYTVLARRYRSKTFDEVIGQEQVAQTLKRAIESGRIAHAYLFCGTRGTGKTSMARILAKALNCEKSDRPTAEPCGECDSCLSIARGDDMDVIEIDAASNTGVDNVREIIENAQYRPARSRFKIYIIDEAHMLSKQAFNALLKTLEEPPGHVKFVLATTEPEKLLATILSRVQRYDFRNIPTREIADHLKNISKSEKIQADDDALLLVAKAGAGSMRDALSLLDRLLSVGEKKLTVEMIEQMLGMPRAAAMFDLVQAVGAGDVKGVLQQAGTLVTGGLSPDSLIASMIDHLRNLLVLRTCGADSDLVEVPGIPMDQLVTQADRFDPVVLSQDIAILEELRRHLRSSQAGRALLDATLVRLALAEQFSTVEQLLAGVNGDGGAPALKKNAEPRIAALSPAQHDQRSSEKSTTVADAGFLSAPQATAPAVGSSGVLLDDDDDLPRPGKVWHNSGPSLSALLKQQTAAAPPPDTVPVPVPSERPPQSEPSNVEPVAPAELSQIWKSLLQLLAEKGPALPSLLSHGQFIGVENGRAVIRFADATLAAMLDRNGKKDAIRDGLSSLLNQNVGVLIEIDASCPAAVADAPAAVNPKPVRSPPRIAPAPVATPAMQINNGIRLTPELKESLRENNPVIAAAMSELGAEIVRVE
jgi:DNA polymerase III subunit gamma/tau